MSNTIDIDYNMWDWYIKECKALEIKPSPSDYMVWLEEMDLDRSEHD